MLPFSVPEFSQHRKLGLPLPAPSFRSANFLQQSSLFLCFFALYPRNSNRNSGEIEFAATHSKQTRRQVLIATVSGVARLFTVKFPVSRKPALTTHFLTLPALAISLFLR